MAISNLLSSWFAWTCTGIFGFLLVFCLITSGPLEHMSFKEDKIQSTAAKELNGSSSSFGQLSQENYLGSSSYQLGKYAPVASLHRKLMITTLPLFQKLPQDTTPPPQGPSPIQNRVHLQELSADKEQTSSTSSPSGDSQKVEFSPLRRGKSSQGSYSTKNQIQYQEVELDSNGQNTSISSISKLQDGQDGVSVESSKRQAGVDVDAVLRKLPKDSTPPSQGPSPTHNGVHLHKLSSSSSVSKITNGRNTRPRSRSLTSSSTSYSRKEGTTYDSLVFQELPKDTAIPPRGPSPIHN